MPQDIMNMIYEICPMHSLKESLLIEDYDSAYIMLTEMIDELDFFPSKFSIFDKLLNAINCDDLKKVRKVIMLTERLFFLNVARNIVGFYACITGEDEKIANDINEEKDLLFRYTRFIQRYKDVPDLDIDDFSNKFLSLKDKTYESEKAFSIVFDYPCIPDANDASYAMGFLSYLEGLILANEVTYEDVWEAILQDDPDSLMDKVKMIKYLREIYYKNVAPLVKEKQKMLKAELNFGLKRNKPLD